MSGRIALDRRLLSAVLGGCVWLALGEAQALTYTTEHMSNFASCEASCRSNSSLMYTDAQVSFFDAAMRASGHQRLRRFANESVWAADITEDGLGGKDNSYSDDGDMYVFSGHGGSGAGHDRYYVPMCQRARLSAAGRAELTAAEATASVERVRG